MHCLGKDLIRGGEEGDGPPIVEVLHITFLRDKTYHPLNHPWVKLHLYLTWKLHSSTCKDEIRSLVQYYNTILGGHAMSIANICYNIHKICFQLCFFSGI